ncbi:MAG: ABC transporter permease [Chloroflexia bacterium]|nr:ABC transporter permease [Chloroflexia bacterium]
MDALRDALSYVQDNPDRFWRAVTVHVRLSATALLLAMVVFIPIGVIVSRSRRIGPSLVAGVAALRVIPSLALLFILFPILGPGEDTARWALFVLAGPALVINTDAGLRNVSTAVIESARGMGMTSLQVFTKIQVPLALPVIVGGVRTASIEIIASAVLAAYIGAGGLGNFITSGLTLLDTRLLLVGAIPVTILALLAEGIFGTLERVLAPPVT